MSGLSIDTVIQTTWRVPFAVCGLHEFQIAFESTQNTWVSFIINGHTGQLYQIEGFAPTTQIPNWYTKTPFSRWSITVDPKHSVLLEGTTILEHVWETDEPPMMTFLSTFTPQAICSLWLGKFGYTILRP